MELKTNCVVTHEVILSAADLAELMELRVNAMNAGQLRNMKLNCSARLVEWIDRLIEFSKGKLTE